MLLIQPDAGGTGNAFQNQCSLAAVFVALVHKAFLQLFRVIQPDLLQNISRQSLGLACALGAVGVVIGQAGIDDGLGDGLAACAAGGFGLSR
jgi:hypothetical protein